MASSQNPDTYPNPISLPALVAKYYQQVSTTDDIKIHEYFKEHPHVQSVKMNFKTYNPNTLHLRGGSGGPEPQHNQPSTSKAALSPLMEFIAWDEDENALPCPDDADEFVHRARNILWLDDPENWNIKLNLYQPTGKDGVWEFAKSYSWNPTNYKNFYIKNGIAEKLRNGWRIVPSPAKKDQPKPKVHVGEYPYFEAVELSLQGDELVGISNKNKWELDVPKWLQRARKQLDKQIEAGRLVVLQASPDREDEESPEDDPYSSSYDEPPHTGGGDTPYDQSFDGRASDASARPTAPADINRVLSAASQSRYGPAGPTSRPYDQSFEGRASDPGARSTTPADITRLLSAAKSRSGPVGPVYQRYDQSFDRRVSGAGAPSATSLDINRVLSAAKSRSGQGGSVSRVLNDQISLSTGSSMPTAYAEHLTTTDIASLKAENKRLRDLLLERSISCPLCKKTFPTDEGSQLDKHIESHADMIRSNSNCPICEDNEWAFMTNQGKRRHLENHQTSLESEKMRNFWLALACPICDMDLAKMEAADIVTHIAQHSSVIQYCELCGLHVGACNEMERKNHSEVCLPGENEAELQFCRNCGMPENAEDREMHESSCGDQRCNTYCMTCGFDIRSINHDRDMLMDHGQRCVVPGGVAGTFCRRCGVKVADVYSREIEQHTQTCGYQLMDRNVGRNGKSLLSQEYLGIYLRDEIDDFADIPQLCRDPYPLGPHNHWINFPNCQLSH